MSVPNIRLGEILTAEKVKKGGLGSVLSRDVSEVDRYLVPKVRNRWAFPEPM